MIETQDEMMDDDEGREYYVKKYSDGVVVVVVMRAVVDYDVHPELIDADDEKEGEEIQKLPLFVDLFAVAEESFHRQLHIFFE